MESNPIPTVIDIHTATIDALVAVCFSPSREIIGKILEGSSKRVVKVSEQAVIKFGIGITETEANNQKGAYLLLDPRIVRVPWVYRFFTRGQYGYIVMEYIKGQVLDPLEDPSRISKVSNALAHMAEISRRVPGPLRSGIARGLLWSEKEHLPFENISDIERYYNSRLEKCGPQLVFGQCSLVLCHLDIAPRNVVWQEDGTICLLDWECAGFYPRVLEVCSQRIIKGRDGAFNRILLEQMVGLTEEEEVQAGLIARACFNELHYYL